MSIRDSFLVWNWYLFPLFSQRWIPLNFWRPYSCCHSLLEFICVSITLCLGNIVYLAYLSLSGFYNHSASSTWLSMSNRSDLMNIFHFKLSILRLSLFAHSLLIGVCVAFQLLQDKVFQMMMMQNKALIYSYSQMLSGVILLLRLLNKTIIFSSLDSWPKFLHT